jgi:hypothetical protein
MAQRYLSVCILVVILMAGYAAADTPSYVGGLATEGTIAGLVGSGLWITPGPTMISWNVIQDTAGFWNYTYTFGDPPPIPTSVIVQCSRGLSSGSFLDVLGDFASYGVGQFDPGPSYPGLPGSIYGIKFDGVTDINAVVHFHCWSAPVWGNGYGMDGNLGGADNYVYNSTFLDPQPTEPPSNGSVRNHLLTPDSPIPDASTLVLACCGAAPALVFRRRRSGASPAGT